MQMELVDFIVVPITIILSGIAGSMITLNYIRAHSIPKAKVDNTLANGNFTDTLHPLVKEIYELFVDDKTINNFKEEYYGIVINEIKWWSDVFETHRNIMGTSTKPKSEKQIVKWLQHPHSDSAAYKMWGNGVCLNNVIFVLAGIVWAYKGGENG